MQTTQGAVLALTDELRRRTQPIWEAQQTHPFVRALGAGELSADRFRFYLLQDGLFLLEFAKLFAAAARRAMTLDTLSEFLRRQSETLAAEHALHRDYARLWRMSEAEMLRTLAAPTTYAYARHLLHVGEIGTLAEIAAAALPRVWGHADTARALLAGRPAPSDHPFGAWLAWHASPEYAGIGDWLRAKLDDWAPEIGLEERRRIEAHFLMSARYEWMFWDMSWRMESWPV